jgi:SWI/SNF-related matrix-associated actin-dependent regulator 1 of chromatin subfamily A
VRLLLGRGAGPNYTDSAGDTPLMAAVAKGHAGVARELAARGAALDAAHPVDGCTAFHYACADNQPGCVAALVDLGCDTGIKDNNAMTGEQWAAQYGHAAVLEQLQEATERRRELEAERAAAAQREEVGRLIARQAFGAAAPLLARMLRDTPADPRLLAWEAEVAAAQAAAEAAAEANAAALLAEVEAEGSGRGSVGGQSKSQKKREKQRQKKEQAAAAAAAAAAADGVRKLEPELEPQMAATMAAAAVGAGGATARALYQASQAGDLAEMAQLLDAGAEPDTFISAGAQNGDIYRTTTLIQAAHRGQLEVVRLLLDHGADPSLADSDGDTPLMQAAGLGHVGVVRELAARGADLDGAHPETGGTAFHLACFNDQPECVAALLELGCDTAITAINGRTGKQAAANQGHAAVLERLAAAQAAAEAVAEANAAALLAELEAEGSGRGGVGRQSKSQKKREKQRRRKEAAAAAAAAGGVSQLEPEPEPQTAVDECDAGEPPSAPAGAQPAQATAAAPGGKRRKKNNKKKGTRAGAAAGPLEIAEPGQPEPGAGYELDRPAPPEPEADEPEPEADEPEPELEADEPEPEPEADEPEPELEADEPEPEPEADELEPEPEADELEPETDEPEPELSASAQQLIALTAVPMAEWSEEQVLAWAELVELEPETGAALRSVFGEEDTDGDDLATLPAKRLQKMLKRGGLRGDLPAAASAVLAARDALLACASPPRREAAAPAEAAAAAKAAPSCQICFEPYGAGIVPRMLSCGHTFCEPCLSKMLRCAGSGPTQ